MDALDPIGRSASLPDEVSEEIAPVAAMSDTKIVRLMRLGDARGKEAPGEPENVANRHIGPYRLVSPLGEGGFGRVWRAEQEEPIRRQVALKVIKPGMVSLEIVARFEGERQALALMDHPHIATVLDAGETEGGQPWFAMELVEGVPITDYCDARCLTIPERLRLFVPICRAVQHAHQKGVLHRDLKPSNILVEESDGCPVPKVIDFGIAKALEAGGEGSTGLSLLRTQGFSLVGTPSYISPEQAGLDGLDVDSRSDLYSLGVVLYELLTGTTPLTRETAGADLPEVLRKVREWDPPSPRRRVSELREGGSSLAATCGTEWRRLQTQLRGDLDWITLKALEKDRERRYSSAAALAEDLERHLRSEPVSAGPPTASYRFGRMARRHKGTLAAASFVVAALLSGLGLTTWQAIRATRAERVAEAQLAETLREKQRADAEADRADERAAVAEAVAGFLKNDILLQAGGQGQANAGFAPNPDLTLREALDRAAAMVGESLGSEPMLEAEIRRTLGTSYIDVGMPKSAIPQFKRAKEIFHVVRGESHPETLTCSLSLIDAIAMAGSSVEALSMIEEVRTKLAEKFGPEADETIRATRILADTYIESWRADEALPLCLQVIPPLRRKLGENHPTTLSAMHDLARSLGQLHRVDEALPVFETVFKQREKIFGAEHPLTNLSKEFLGVALIENGRAGEAETILEDAFEIAVRIHGETHPRTLRVLRAIAKGEDQSGLLEEAADHYREVLRLRTQALGQTNPDTLNSMIELGSCLRKVGQYDGSVEVLEEARALVVTNLGHKSPIAPKVIRELGRARFQNKEFSVSTLLFEEALQGYESIYGEAHPDAILTLANLGVSSCESGNVAFGVATLDEALRRIEGSPEIYARRFGWVRQTRDLWSRRGGMNPGEGKTALLFARLAEEFSPELEKRPAQAP